MEKKIKKSKKINGVTHIRPVRRQCIMSFWLIIMSLDDIIG